MPLAESKFSMELVKNYFSQLNPIARRIANDIDETKANYGQLWCTLSSNEQNDIINETLIRPEVSLRYFDSFSSASLSSSSSPSSSSSAYISPTANCVSADSLTAIVLKNLNDAEKTKNSGKENKNSTTVGIKQFYGFDGRNLRTFSSQKVGLKIVHDDALGAYRDEHSMPFSFRTRSQINLLLFIDDSTNAGYGGQYVHVKPAKKDDEVCLLNASYRTTIDTNAAKPDMPKHDKTSIENYKKLQNELKLNLRRDSKEKMVTSKNELKLSQTNVTYERLDSQKATANIPVLPSKVPKSQACRPQVKPPPAPINASNNNEKKSIIVDCKSLELTAMNRSSMNQNEQRLKALLSSNSNASSMSYAVYADNYYDHGENTNLMSNLGSSSGNGFLTASSSSAATSDDDDEKTLCEEVKLLDNDSSLRKGFDFLNNW